MTDVQKSNIVKPGQELDPLQNGYLAAELERAGGKKGEIWSEVTLQNGCQNYQNDYQNHQNYYWNYQNGGKKRKNLVRSDFAEWLFPSERLHQKTSLRMIPSPVTLVDLQQIHIILKRNRKDILKFGVLEGGREINLLKII